MLRQTTRLLCSGAAVNAASDFLESSGAVRFNAELAASGTHTMPRKAFDDLLVKHGVGSAHASALEAAGAVYFLGELVHCHPPALVQAAPQLAKAGSAANDAANLEWDPCTSMRAELAQARTELAAATPAFDAVVDKAARRRRVIWGSGVCLGGIQLAVVSRLTYFDLDWDTMEPISYFLGSGTSLAFFALMLRHGGEASAGLIDRAYVGETVAKDDAVVRYLELKDRVAALENTIRAKEAWVGGWQPSDSVQP